MVIDFYFLQTGAQWSNLEVSGLEYSFLDSLPNYLLINPVLWAAHSIDFNPLGTIVGLSSDSNPSHYDQEDIVRFLLSSDSSIVNYSGDNNINIVLINTVNTNVSHATDGESENYRVSFSDVLNTFFSESANGQIQIVRQDAYSADSPSVGRVPDLLSRSNQTAGDIYINNLDSKATVNLAPGEYGFWLLLHELGHAIAGLEDVRETSQANTYLDSQQYTMMSYKPHGGTYATGLQLLDIAAIQDTYSQRNYATRAGNTEYTLGKGLGFAGASESDAFLYTIWDGGGVDTIDASGYQNYHVTLDLRQGGFSSVGVNAFGNAAQDNLAVAYFTVIENAIGTNKESIDLQDRTGDILIGNAWNNELRGGKGNDALYGDGVVYGQIITPDDSSDDDAGFLGIDVNGDGSLYIDPYRAWTAADGDNPQYAKDLSGNDILYGDEGDDRLYGGNGDDRLYGGDDDDYLAPGHGNDIIDGGAGINTLTYADLRGSVYWDAVFEYRPLQLIIDTRMDDQGYGHTYDMFGDTDSWKNIQKIELGVMNTQVIGSDEGQLRFYSHPSWMAPMDLDYSGLAGMSLRAS